MLVFFLFIYNILQYSTMYKHISSLNNPLLVDCNNIFYSVTPFRNLYSSFDYILNLFMCSNLGGLFIFNVKTSYRRYLSLSHTYPLQENCKVITITRNISLRRHLGHNSWLTTEWVNSITLYLNPSNCSLHIWTFSPWNTWNLSVLESTTFSRIQQTVLSITFDISL